MIGQQDLANGLAIQAGYAGEIFLIPAPFLNQPRNLDRQLRGVAWNVVHGLSIVESPNAIGKVSSSEVEAGDWRSGCESRQGGIPCNNLADLPGGCVRMQ